MFRGGNKNGKSGIAFPHVCGDVPYKPSYNEIVRGFSPRMWGCSAYWVIFLLFLLLFPTYVGMFRITHLIRLRAYSFPHVCGDVPENHETKNQICSFSPRMWGCSVPLRLQCHIQLLFPTYVGMFRVTINLLLCRHAFPHVCGDVPCTLGGCRATLPLFPTYVGMFRIMSINSFEPDAFPHVCGDVPDIGMDAMIFICFSPRMWGCSENI